jgi:hypothetical protein
VYKVVGHTSTGICGWCEFLIGSVTGLDAAGFQRFIKILMKYPTDLVAFLIAGCSYFGSQINASLALDLF